MTRSRAIAHFKRTGLILPGAQGEVADWLANRRSNDEQLRDRTNRRGNFPRRND